MELLDASLLDWSRAQFALTAMYHWLFVPLTLGVGVVMAVMESRRERSITSSFKKMTGHHPTITERQLLPNAI